MQLAQKITIDLLDFFKTGRFDCLKLSQTKEYIINNFPDPDGFEEGYMNYRKHGDIWRYGNIELHFDNENKLYLIFSDYISTLNGGENLILEKWILNKSSDLTLLKVMDALNKEHIDFEKRTALQLNEIIVKLSTSKVELFFQLFEEEGETHDYKTIDPNTYKLGAFSLMQKPLKQAS